MNRSYVSPQHSEDPLCSCHSKEQFQSPHLNIQHFTSGRSLLEIGPKKINNVRYSKRFVPKNISVIIRKKCPQNWNQPNIPNERFKKV